MIPLEEAQEFVLRSLDALSPVELALEDALGCVAAEQLRAEEPVPGFKNSSMDGYALRSIDTLTSPARLNVTGTIFAGDGTDQGIKAGQAKRIMTGAPIPQGADAVCMIEETSLDSDGRTVLIGRTIASGECVRQPGEDIGVGQVLLERGTELAATLIGVLASQGRTSLLVHPRPRVGILSTGNELCGPGSPLPIGKIRDVNRPMLLALLRSSGFTGVDLGVASDEEIEISHRIRGGLTTCDAVVVTGGVSVGDADFVKTVLAQICEGNARWMQVAMKPGKPFAFGIAHDRAVPIFGLPGNPVSTRVSFEMFVRPALRRLAGYQTLQRPIIQMVLDCPMHRKSDGKLHLVHVQASFHRDGRMHIESVSRQGSHLLSAVTEANALVLLADGSGLEKGDVARTMMLNLEGSN